MVYKCTGCGETHWRGDCDVVHPDGGSGVIVCPDCESKLRKHIGTVETAIIDTLPADDALDLRDLTEETEYSTDTIRKALEHLVTMGYIGTTPGWDYRLGTKGREKKQSLA